MAVSAFDQAQATVVGCVIERPEIAGEVFAAIRIDDLDTQYRAIAEAIHGLRLSKSEISRLSIIDEMTRRGTLGTAGGQAEIHRIAGFGFGDHNYALDVIARTSRLRRLDVTALRLHNDVEAMDADPLAIAKKALAAVQGVVDTIEADGDITTPTLGEFLNSSDPEHDWVIPGLLERGDRMVLTGAEGLGKSFLQRQLAVCAAAGIHPFNRSRIKPQRVLYVDCENGPVKLRRALRGLVNQATLLGEDPRERMFLEPVPSGLDLTRPEDEAWLVRRVSAIQPALLFIGPIYRLHADDPNKEEPARKVTQVLDRCRSAANCALVAEAHAGHGYAQSDRPLRPTGTSLWLRWPEFGYGMQPAEGHNSIQRRVAFKAWRGDREERDWPSALRSGGPLPWSIDFGFEETA
jgi:replicative DNA helicase